ncbi:MAG: glutamate formimidoyltransferase [Chloroflexi bacterium]|nr:glutamate formimidoyltransferase [Chloroflexota bacterium]
MTDRDSQPDVEHGRSRAPARGPATLLACVPNVSEGRRPEIVERIAQAADGVTGIRVLDVHSDSDHHRSVLTIVGNRVAVEEAAFRLADVATRSIDIRDHRGVHPRIGALDVLPFVPLAGTSMESCVDVAHRVGRRIADELGVPVYFYADAALRPEFRLLVNVRRGEYEGLLASIGRDPTRAPDAGPRLLGPAGATAVGARRALVAFNVHLRTSDVAVATTIARAVRSSSGGLPGVQAIGLPTSRSGIVQVSMNLTDLDVTPLHVAVERVRVEASRHGVEVAESELVGLMPATTTLAAAAAALGLPSLGARQVVELALERAHDA